MDTLVGIWNFLWEYQVVLVFPLILVVWIAVRGYDLGKWLRNKWRKKGRETPLSNPESLQDENTDSVS